MNDRLNYREWTALRDVAAFDKLWSGKLGYMPTLHRDQKNNLDAFRSLEARGLVKCSRTSQSEMRALTKGSGRWLTRLLIRLLTPHFPEGAELYYLTDAGRSLWMELGGRAPWVEWIVR